MASSAAKATRFWVTNVTSRRHRALQARSLTRELLAEGHDRARLLDAYELAITRLYEEDLDRAAEELLEVMAELEGRCSPHARL